MRLRLKSFKGFNAEFLMRLSGRSRFDLNQKLLSF